MSSEGDLKQAILEEIAKGLKDYVEKGRREDGWINSTRPHGHDFDVQIDDDLKGYFGKAQKMERRHSSYIMRRTSLSSSIGSGDRQSFMHSQQFEDRKVNVQKDLESSVLQTWVKEEKRRQRKVKGTSTPWKGWASSRSFGEMLEMNDAYYRAHHKRKIKRRNTSLPDHCIDAQRQRIANEPSVSKELGVEQLFDMAAEAVVLADGHLQDVATTRSYMRRKLEEREEARRAVRRRGSNSMIDMAHEANSRYGETFFMDAAIMESDDEDTSNDEVDNTDQSDINDIKEQHGTEEKRFEEDFEAESCGDDVAYRKEEGRNRQGDGSNDVFLRSTNSSQQTRRSSTSEKDERSERVNGRRHSSSNPRKGHALDERHKHSQRGSRRQSSSSSSRRHQEKKESNRKNQMNEIKARRGSHTTNGGAERRMQETPTKPIPSFSTLLKAIKKEDTTTIEHMLLNGQTALLDMEDNRQRKPIHYATHHGCSSSLERLLMLDANPNTINSQGRTALHFACGKGFPTIVEQLLNCGASLSLCGKNGVTPLHLAAANGHANVIRLILEADVDLPLQHRDLSGKRAVDLAREYGHEDCEQLLSVTL
eukprot:m.216021 g.216021  ORF g.216021 m.216021 type:complete len:593 (+) comp13800_c1_seq1:138-1916(+)